MKISEDDVFTLIALFAGACVVVAFLVAMEHMSPEDKDEVLQIMHASQGFE